MSDSVGFAVPLHGGARVVDRSPETVDVDVHAPHYFWFGGRLWLKEIGACVQALGLGVAGVFLLTQISSTPKLAVQVAVVGGLLTLGGIALLFRSLGAFRAGLEVNPTGLLARLGWSGLTVPWSRVACWSVRDGQRNPSEPTGITVWAAGGKRLLSIPDSHFNDQDLREIRRLFRTFAYGKEAV